MTCQRNASGTRRIFRENIDTSTKSLHIHVTNEEWPKKYKQVINRISKTSKHKKYASIVEGKPTSNAIAIFIKMHKKYQKKNSQKVSASTTVKKLFTFTCNKTSN